MTGNRAEPNVAPRQGPGADAPGTGAAEGDGSPAETETGQGGADLGTETEGAKDGAEDEDAGPDL